MLTDRLTPWRIACASGLALFFACLAYSMTHYTSWYTRLSDFSAISFERKWQIYGLVAFLGSAGATLVTPGRRARTHWAMAWVWAPFIAWALLSATWSVKPEASASYAVFLAAFLAAGALYWQMPERVTRLSAALAVVAIAAGVVILALTLPIRPRTFGGITPNAIGHLGLCAIALGYLAGPPARIAGLVLGLGLLVYAQSRTVLVGALLFLAVYHLVLGRVRSRAGLWPTLAIFGGLGAFVGLLAPLLLGTLIQTMNSLLGVTERARGVSSGFTGRTVYWSDALALIQHQPLRGYGFRTRGSLRAAIEDLGLSGHSGMLNAVLDVGLVGALLLTIAYLASLVMVLRTFADSQGDHDRITAAYLIGYLPILAVEPNYLNFAGASSFLMVLFLCNPLALRWRSGEATAKAPAQRPCLVGGVGVSR